jgi:hypothetical protein
MDVARATVPGRLCSRCEPRMGAGVAAKDGRVRASTRAGVWLVCPPFQHQHTSRPTRASTNGLPVQVGLGIMALPASVATLGWGPGLAALLAMFALNLYTGLLLWRLRVACPGAMSYTHLGAEVSC